MWTASGPIAGGAYAVMDVYTEGFLSQSSLCEDNWAIPPTKEGAVWSSFLVEGLWTYDGISHLITTSKKYVIWITKGQVYPIYLWNFFPQRSERNFETNQARIFDVTASASLLIELILLERHRQLSPSGLRTLGHSNYSLVSFASLEWQHGRLSGHLGDLTPAESLTAAVSQSVGQGSQAPESHASSGKVQIPSPIADLRIRSPGDGTQHDHIHKLCGASTHTLKFENGGLDGAESFCSAPGADPAAISSCVPPPPAPPLIAV